MQHEFQHEYPILEFELITSFKILAYLHLNFNREHTHMQPQTYLCQAVRIFYYFMIRSQLVSQLIHVLSMVPDSGAI